ncbi:hypothetical protein P43SY_004233 [Pythium insidiosum]|uniref:Uncharacterized protein n=1 Tax=Pythium insidiosum TaxID=114742 RepID=A0AAD5LHJ8_PYTIN|nr:hypothetical protein P43SY_004233 [Pythium insidiosum]
MIWTPELNSLLNQCVFETGYDFTAAASLLLTRARQLRLLGPEGFTLSSDDCQVQWMAINPIDDEAGPEDDEDPCAPQQIGDLDRIAELRSPTPTHQSENQPRGASVLDIPDGCPRLELSISDADLDALINALPSQTAIASDSLDWMEAESKSSPVREQPSEMQWVLSFLVDPDRAAHQDAEAKNLLDRHSKGDDDNYQFFLQELHHANLLNPPEAPASPVRTVDASGDESREHKDGAMAADW